MSDLGRAYALLSSLKQNVPNTYEVGKEWVDDYHAILSSVEKEIGQSLREFRVSESELHRRVTGGNYLTGEVDYGGIVVERSRLLLKVDAVLGYFQFQMEPGKKKPIGFKTP